MTIGGTPEVQKLLEEKGSTLLKSGTTLAELIRRPELRMTIWLLLIKKDLSFRGMSNSR